MSEWNYHYAHPVNEIGEIEDALDVMADALNMSNHNELHSPLNPNGMACILRLLAGKANDLATRLDEGSGYTVVEVPSGKVTPVKAAA